MDFNLTEEQQGKIGELYMNTGAHAIYEIQLRRGGPHYKSDLIYNPLRFKINEPRYLKAMGPIIIELKKILGGDFKTSCLEIHEYITSTNAFRNMSSEILREIRREKRRNTKDQIMGICAAFFLVFGFPVLIANGINYLSDNYNDTSQIQHSIPNDSFTNGNNNKVRGLELRLEENSSTLFLVK